MELKERHHVAVGGEGHRGGGEQGGQEGGGGEERKVKTESVERSNSRVTARVSNLMRWPRTNKAGGGEKEQVGGGQLQQTKNSFV